jgi:hypothetical protein
MSRLFKVQIKASIPNICRRNLRNGYQQNLPWNWQRLASFQIREVDKASYASIHEELVHDFIKLLKVENELVSCRNPRRFNVMM